MHGTGDLMADPAATVELVERAGSDDKTLRLVPDGYHALLRDLDRERPSTRSSTGSTPAARSRRLSGGFELQAADEDLDAAADLVADRADGVDAEAGGVVELPVLVALAGEDRAGVAAAHRDDDVGGPDDLVGPRLRVAGW